MLVLYWVNLALNFMFELFLEMPSWTVFGDWKFMYHCPYFLTPQWTCVYHYVIYVVSTSAKNSAKKKKYISQGLGAISSWTKHLFTNFFTTVDMTCHESDFFFLAESHDYDYDIAKVVSTMDSPTTTIILVVKNIKSLTLLD